MANEVDRRLLLERRLDALEELVNGLVSQSSSSYGRVDASTRSYLSDGDVSASNSSSCSIRGKKERGTKEKKKEEVKKKEDGPRPKERDKKEKKKDN